jgi:hypothetical protein
MPMRRQSGMESIRRFGACVAELKPDIVDASKICYAGESETGMRPGFSIVRRHEFLRKCRDIPLIGEAIGERALVSAEAAVDEVIRRLPAAAYRHRYESELSYLVVNHFARCVVQDHLAEDPEVADFNTIRDRFAVDRSGFDVFFREYYSNGRDDKDLPLVQDLHDLIDRAMFGAAFRFTRGPGSMAIAVGDRSIGELDRMMRIRIKNMEDIPKDFAVTFMFYHMRDLALTALTGKAPWLRAA